MTKIRCSVPADNLTQWASALDLDEGMCTFCSPPLFLDREDDSTSRHAHPGRTFRRRRVRQSGPIRFSYRLRWHKGNKAKGEWEEWEERTDGIMPIFRKRARHLLASLRRCSAPNKRLLVLFVP